MHWRDEYELHADQARGAADSRPVESLLEARLGSRLEQPG